MEVHPNLEHVHSSYLRGTPLHSLHIQIQKQEQYHPLEYLQVFVSFFVKFPPFHHDGNKKVHIISSLKEVFVIYLQ